MTTPERANAGSTPRRQTADDARAATDDTSGHERLFGAAPSFLRTVALIGSPLAVGTVLLFYFGWVRTRVQAQALGYDTTVLDMTTVDYLLKSVNVLFVPIVVVLVLALCLNRLHTKLVGSTPEGAGERHATEQAGREPTGQTVAKPHADSPPEKAPPELPSLWARGLKHAWIGWLAIGMVLFLGVPQVQSYVIPFAICLSIATYLYSRSRSVGQKLDLPETVPVSMRTVLVLLLAFGLFWATERVARAAGTAFAEDIAARPQQLPSTTVYSKEDLLLAGSGVAREQVGGPSSAFRFRYTGLRLLQRNGDRYFLLDLNGTPASARLVVLRDGEGLRVELGG